jgi:hypothetical protein
LHCPFRYWPQSPLARRASRVEAVQTTDKVLLTVRDQLGVDQDAQMLKTIARKIAPAIGWRPATAPVGVR